jgi:outer membrane protein TolC
LTDISYRKANIREELQGVFPESATVFGLSIKQMIFDDTIISNYRSSARLYDGSELEREAERINVLAAAGTAFLGLGLTQAIYDVEVENLRLSEANLELARLRRDVGYSGPDEIYRWEAMVAQNRSTLFSAARDVEAARITFNQVLGVEQNRRWLLEEISVDPQVFPFLGGRIDPMFQDLEQWDRFREALVRFAIDSAPEVRAVDRQLEAAGIQVGQLKRRYFVPSAFFDFSYRYRLSGGDDDLPSGDKDFYVFSFGADYPLFQGLRKAADIAKAEAERLALEGKRRFVSELIEQETRTALRGCESSFSRIEFARQAAEAATNNLRIVQDKYAEGIVNVTDLISAQNDKLVSDQVAAAAVYEFLIDLVELQRAISWFEDDKTPDEQEAFVEQMISVVRSESSR